MIRTKTREIIIKNKRKEKKTREIINWTRAYLGCLVMTFAYCYIVYTGNVIG
jgi:hypothetical protein